ncbi:MAG TPA: HNH endonuclease signature motif containing protein [Streptosporangiaceae bacterium]|nr:HNH endonuclease signature motif containing protein [Streptosporangiaceae bacterium]
MATVGDLCDASIVPVVTGHVDHELLDKLASVLLDNVSSHGAPQEPDGQSKAARLGADFARNLILRNAVALLSGPDGLASRLRTGLLAGPAASISLPLDVGTATETIPPHLRRAVTLRDKHCGFAGCTETDCQVHHIIPISEGGKTCLENLTLGCRFHHLIAIHLWGWKVVFNPDGTKTTISPEGSLVLHSHDPPGTSAA